MKIKIKISKKELAKIIAGKATKIKLQINPDQLAKDVLKAIHGTTAKSQE